MEERDGLKASLAATNDELAKSKAKANALDVSVVQHGASVDRLKVRDRSLARENPRQTHARTHRSGTHRRAVVCFFFPFARKNVFVFVLAKRETSAFDRCLPRAAARRRDPPP